MRLSRIHSNTVLDFYSADVTTSLELPLFAAEFPSPAEDYVEIALDLNKELVKHPAATFYARVKGSCSMVDAGIEDGDLLVIDKALDAKDGDIAVCFILVLLCSFAFCNQHCQIEECREVKDSFPYRKLLGITSVYIIYIIKHLYSSNQKKQITLFIL